MTAQMLVMFGISLKKTCWCDTTLNILWVQRQVTEYLGITAMFCLWTQWLTRNTAKFHLYQVTLHFKTKVFSSVCYVQFVCDVDKTLKPLHLIHHHRKQFILLNKFHRCFPQTDSSSVQTDHNASHHLHFLCNRHVSLTEPHTKSVWRGMSVNFMEHYTF